MDPPQTHSRPPYPTLQTPSNMPAFQSSSSSLSSVSSHSSFISPTSSTSQRTSAPLPSPTGLQPPQYFSMDASSVQQRMAYQQSAYTQQQPAQQYHQAQQSYAQQQFAQQQYAQQQLQLQQQQQQQQQQSQAGGPTEYYSYRPDRSGAGSTAQETARYISDYGLLAEAAKRAEMAVLLRDLEGVELR